MNRSKAFLLCLFGALLVVGAGALFGITPLVRGGESARPPCEQLPDRKSVTDALASHEDLVNRIQSVGAGVKVDAATPCEGQPDRAIVSIKHKTGDEREGVDDVLLQEGFGVPVELVRN